MQLSQIFNVFSRRDKPQDPYIRTVPVTLRRKVIMYCHEVFSGKRVSSRIIRYSSYYRDNPVGQFWEEIHQALAYRHGRFKLVDDHILRDKTGDASAFLLSCKDEEFLDFVEYIFRVESVYHISIEPNEIVADLNELFTSENIGYELTERVEERVIEHGQPGEVIKLVAHPKVIHKDDQAVHATIIKPVLELLADPKYKMANQEYREALEDYRKGDYGDCLTKACSAYESVMKIICAEKKWPYNQNDTAQRLITTIIDKAGLAPYYEQLLMTPVMLRNKLSKSHGAGATPKTPSENVARFAINSAASAIIFLVNETK